MKKNIRFLSIKFTFFIMLTTFAMSTGAAPIQRAMMLSYSCAGCHGTDGHSPGAIPSIAGKSKQFLEEAMKDFRSGKRSSTVMGRHAKGYSDEEIKMIADFFSSK